MILNLKTKIILTFLSLLMVVGLLLWEHFHGGVVSHYLFQNEKMPKLSNWWSLLSIPVIVWIMLSIIQKRQNTSQKHASITNLELFGFAGGFLFGVFMTLLFYNMPDLTNYLLLFSFVLALIFPIYKAEYYLGFILSTMFGFGGILPVIFGLLLMAVYAIEYLLIRKAILFILNKIRIRQ